MPDETKKPVEFFVAELELGKKENATRWEDEIKNFNITHHLNSKCPPFCRYSKEYNLFYMPNKNVSKRSTQTKLTNGQKNHRKILAAFRNMGQDTLKKYLKALEDYGNKEKLKTKEKTEEKIKTRLSGPERVPIKSKSRLSVPERVPIKSNSRLSVPERVPIKSNSRLSGPERVPIKSNSRLSGPSKNFKNTTKFTKQKNKV